MQTLNTLRKAVADSGKSRYQLSKESGIAQSVLSRFMSGETGLSIQLIEKLCDVLDLKIVIVGKSKKG